MSRRRLPPDADLQTRIDDLPTELQDLIRKFALDFSFFGFIEALPSRRNLILRSDRRRHLKDLRILQLSQATRANYAEAFYARCNFVFDGGVPVFSIHFELRDWLKSLTAEHRGFIGDVQIVHSVHPGCPDYLGRGSLVISCREVERVKREFGEEVAAKIRCSRANML